MNSHISHFHGGLKDLDEVFGNGIFLALFSTSRLPFSKIVSFFTLAVQEVDPVVDILNELVE